MVRAINPEVELELFEQGVGDANPLQQLLSRFIRAMLRGVVPAP